MEFIFKGEVRTIPKLDPYAIFFGTIAVVVLSFIIGLAGLLMYNDPSMGWVGTTVALFVCGLITMAGMMNLGEPKALRRKYSGVGLVSWQSYILLEG